MPGELTPDDFEAMKQAKESKEIDASASESSDTSAATSKPAGETSSETPDAQPDPTPPPPPTPPASGGKPSDADALETPPKEGSLESDEAEGESKVMKKLNQVVEMLPGHPTNKGSDAMEASVDLHPLHVVSGAPKQEIKNEARYKSSGMGVGLGFFFILGNLAAVVNMYIFDQTWKTYQYRDPMHLFPSEMFTRVTGRFRIAWYVLNAVSLCGVNISVQWLRVSLDAENYFRNILANPWSHLRFQSNAIYPELQNMVSMFNGQLPKDDTRPQPDLRGGLFFDIIFCQAVVPCVAICDVPKWMDILTILFLLEATWRLIAMEDGYEYDFCHPDGEYNTQLNMDIENLRFLSMWLVMGMSFLWWRAQNETPCCAARETTYHKLNHINEWFEYLKTYWGQEDIRYEDDLTIALDRDVTLPWWDICGYCCCLSCTSSKLRMCCKYNNQYFAAMRPMPDYHSGGDPGDLSQSTSFISDEEYMEEYFNFGKEKPETLAAADKAQKNRFGLYQVASQLANCRSGCALLVFAVIRQQMMIIATDDYCIHSRGACMFLLLWCLITTWSDPYGCMPKCCVLMGWGFHDPRAWHECCWQLHCLFTCTLGRFSHLARTHKMKGTCAGFNYICTGRDTAGVITNEPFRPWDYPAPLSLGDREAAKAAYNATHEQKISDNLQATGPTRTKDS